MKYRKLNLTQSHIPTQVGIKYYTLILLHFYVVDSTIKIAYEYCDFNHFPNLIFKYK